MNLLVKIPTRERGFEWLRGYIDNCLSPDTRILLTLDTGQPAPPQWAIDSGRVYVEWGHSRNKVHAYNRDIDKYIDQFDVLLCGSDDMWVQERGYDMIICDDMRRNFPDTDGCLWYDTEDSTDELRRRLKRQDVAPGDRNFLNHWICMLPIIGRAYYKRFGYVYHESYHSFWCDNEQTRVAQRDRKIVYIPRRIIKHEHPDWGNGMPRDDMYRRLLPQNSPDWNMDMGNFHNRHAHDFPA